jgi:sulfofructose kinase
MGPSRSVICLGITVVDNVLEVDEIPRVPIKILAKNRVRRGGGPASTGAVAAARLGAPTALWSWFGEDPEGDYLASQLKRFGVETCHTVRSADFATVTAFVVVDDSGERLIVAHGVRTVPHSTRHLPLDDLAHAGAVLVDSAWQEGARDVLEAARAAGVPAVFDAESHDVERLTDLARRASHPVFSEEGFDRVMRGAAPNAESCRALSNELGAPVGVTLGARGSLWWSEGALTHVPALAVTVRDTTGAGDVFHGAIAVGLAEGMPLLGAARLGSAVAALKCERGDGWDGVPDRADVDRALRRLA